MDTSTIIFNSAVVVILLAVVFYRTRKQPVKSIYTAFDQWQDALAVAPSIVAAVEQLWQTGEIPKDERLTEAMTQLEEWFPSLTEKQLRTAIEAAVWLTKQGVDILDIELPELDVPGGGKLSARLN